MLGYAIFVVTGVLPGCEANDLLSLVRVEPSPSHTPASPPTHPAHSSTQSKVAGKSKARPPHKRQGESMEPSLHPKHRCPCKNTQHSYSEEEAREEDEHALQMAIAMSASLQQSQESHEIDQQMQVHWHLEKDRSSCGKKEEEDAAITGASLGKLYMVHAVIMTLLTLSFFFLVPLFYTMNYKNRAG